MEVLELRVRWVRAEARNLLLCHSGKCSNQGTACTLTYPHQEQHEIHRVHEMPRKSENADGHCSWSSDSGGSTMMESLHEIHRSSGEKRKHDNRVHTSVPEPVQAEAGG